MSGKVEERRLATAATASKPVTSQLKGPRSAADVSWTAGTQGALLTAPNTLTGVASVNAFAEPASTTAPIFIDMLGIICILFAVVFLRLPLNWKAGSHERSVGHLSP
jgi:hypothetical protein